MERKKIELNAKQYSKDDNEGIPVQKLNGISKFERRKEKSRTFYDKNIEKIIDNFRSIFFEESNKENVQKNSINNLNQERSKNLKILQKRNTNEDPPTRLSSHSTKNLIKVVEIKNLFEEETINKSDDECGKIDKTLNKKKNFKELKKEEDIIKKDNFNFNYNIKKIFGNVNYHKNEKEEEKVKDKNKDKNDSKEKDKDKDDFELSIYKKDEQYIRKVYYSQLLLKKVWKPINDSKRHNSLIIFDWDDTLLPTSFLAPRGIFEDNSELNEKDQAKINKLQESVLKLLTIAISKGDVYIITNAGEGWVEFSAKKYYPKILDLLTKIEVISAREVYEKKFPDDSKRWKVESFLNLKKRLNDDLITNIICLGDSIFEMEAGRILASKFIHAVIKTIKFREKPKPEELNKQLNLVLNQFNSIYNSSKNLTVRVEKKKKKDE
jgi:hypothetical protein